MWRQETVVHTHNKTLQAIRLSPVCLYLRYSTSSSCSIVPSRMMWESSQVTRGEWGRAGVRCHGWEKKRYFTYTGSHLGGEGRVDGKIGHADAKARVNHCVLLVCDFAVWLAPWDGVLIVCLNTYKSLERSGHLPMVAGAGAQLRVLHW